MEKCEHHMVDVKVDAGYAITYCVKCGKILDKKKVARPGEEPDIRWESGLMKDNGGQILHD